MLEETFSRFGIPKTIVSDNGTQFVSRQFKEFCEANGINHVRTAPFHPQSNGQAERFVDTLKRSLKKNQGEGGIEEALQILLSTYRSTLNPNAPLQKSPAEIMLGRPMRTTFDLLKPSPSEHSKINHDDRKQKQNEQFNKQHSAKNRQFNVDDSVDVKVYYNNKYRWQSAIVKERLGNVMYRVQLRNSNRIVRSHANQMRSRPVQEPSASSDSESELPLHTLLAEFHTDTAPDLQSEHLYEGAVDVQQNNEQQPVTPVRRPLRERRIPRRLEGFDLN